MKEAIGKAAAMKKIADAATLENRFLFSTVARHIELKPELREEFRCATGLPAESFERWWEEKLAQEILQSSADRV